MAARLLVVVLVPLLCLQYLVVRRTISQQAIAREALALLDPVELFRIAGSVLGPAAIEETVSIGLTNTDNQTQRPAVAALVGSDLVGTLAASRRSVDVGLDALLDVAGDEVLGSGDRARDEILAVRTELDALRADLDAESLDPRAIRGVFDRLLALLGELVDGRADDLQRANIGAANTHRTIIDRATHLVALHRSAAGEARAVGLVLSPFADAQDPIAAIAAGAAADAAESYFVATLDEDGLHRWDRWQSSPATVEAEQLRPLLWEVLAEGRSGEGAPGDFVRTADPSSTSLLAHYAGVLIDRLVSLDEFANAEFDLLADAVATQGAETTRQLRLWIVALALVTLGSLAMFSLTVRSVMLPLRRLTRRASELSLGQIPTESLPVTGPSDLRMVATSFNTLTTTLATYETQLRDVASGAHPDASGAVELPGSLGRSIRESVELSRRDLLTSLPNRVAAMERLDGLIAAKEQIGVVLVDIDSFKRLNESRGFGTGDMILIEVARRLGGAIRDGEFVARLGSDEFLIVARGVVDTEMALRIAQRLLTEIGQPYEIDGVLIGLSATAGAALGQVGDDARELVREADVALRQARSLGRGRVEMFSAEFQAHVEELSSVEAALRDAVRNGEFELYLQPVMDLTTGNQWGAEALVRWNRPPSSVVAPDDFLSIAEECGVIVDIERWVISEATRILAGWAHDPRTAGLSLAVNISGSHLLEGDLVAELDVGVEQLGVRLDHLEIELTESALLSDFPKASKILGQMRDRGVRVAIDDFDTGYSSMSYLGELPVDTIKIDRVFVARAGQSGYDRSILEIIVQLGQLLKLSVVAEGVEHAEELAFLESRGCDRAQGFLISRPLPIAEFNRWIDARAAASAAAAAAAARRGKTLRSAN